MLCVLIDGILQIFQQEQNHNIRNKRMQFISKNCSLYLTFQNQRDFLKYQTLSGLGFNKLGFYQQCIAQPMNQFYLVEGTSNLFSPSESTNHTFMSGICFNRTCSAQDLQYALGSVFQYANLPFSLVGVRTPSLISQQYSVQNISALTVISIMIFLLVVCSIIDFLKKMKKINYDTTTIQIFSIFTTFKLLESKSQRNKERVKTFSGIKVLSLMAIILTNIGHLVSQAPTTSIYNDYHNGSIFLLFYGVDIWLLVSGFFISYLLLKQYAKLKSTKILLLKIVRRFLRLWPLYFLSLLINYYVLPLIGSGPLWPLLIQYSQQRNCLSLPNVFMLSNFITSDCYNWLWLLQLDFQLCFIFIPVLLLYIHWDKRICKYLFYAIQGVFVLCSILVALMNYNEKYDNLIEYFFKIQYFQENILPITRGSGFIIGYDLGIVFYHFKKMQQKQKQKHWLMTKLHHKAIRALIPLVGFVGFACVAYFLSVMDEQKITLTHNFFLSSLHLLVPLLVSLIFLPSLFGYWSPLKRIFQSPFCHFLSKLSLSIYSVNYMTSLYFIYYRQNDLQLSPFTIIFMAFITFLPAVFLSLILTTIVEIPVFVCKKVFWKTERVTYFEH